MKILSKIRKEYKDFLDYVRDEWEYGHLNELEFNDKFIIKEYAPLGEGHYRALTFEEWLPRRTEIKQIIYG